MTAGHETFYDIPSVRTVIGRTKDGLCSTYDFNESDGMSFCGGHEGMFS